MITDHSHTPNQQQNGGSQSNISQVPVVQVPRTAVPQLASAASAAVDFARSIQAGWLRDGGAAEAAGRVTSRAEPRTE